jgi:2-dehydropantoate 2-reductase
MKITIYGAGAIGSLIGSKLSTEQEVVLVGRPEHVSRINAEGLRVHGPKEEVFRPKAVTSVEGLEAQDVVFITTKAYDTEAAVQAIAPLVGPLTTVVSLQNGLGNIDIMEKAYGSRAVIGLTNMGVTFIGPGEIRLAGDGEIIIGGPSRRRDRAEAVANLLSSAKLTTLSTQDIRAEVWMKAIVNACINPLTALVRKENGILAENQELKAIAAGACREAAKAAEDNGIMLPTGDPFKKVMLIVEWTRSNRSSMLQDVERGRRTEIDEITGALVTAGAAFGVPMPTNQMLWTLVRALDRPPSKI